MTSTCSNSGIIRMTKLTAQPIVEIKDVVKCFSVGTIFGLSDQLLSGMDNAH